MAGESAREEARRAREKAERLARRAEMFEKGADGETATAAVLATLPAGWTSIHDVRWPSRRLANIDHILVGPGGIFVIDSKNWSGRISVQSGHLRQNGRSREKAVAGCADAGLAIAELAGPHAATVFPVLCFATDEPLTGWCRDVMVCSTSTLTQMLLSRPIVLDTVGTTDAWLRLEAQLRAATSTAPAGRAANRRHESASSTYGESRTSRSGSARSRRAAARRKKELSQFLLSLGLAAVLLAYGPQIGGYIGGLVDDNVTSGSTPSEECSTGGDRQDPDGRSGSARVKGERSGQKTQGRSASPSDC